MPATSSSTHPAAIVPPPDCDVQAYKDTRVDAPGLEEPQGKNAFMSWLTNNLHLGTFLPIAIINVLQDINLGLAAVLCLCLALAFLLASFVLYRAGYVKVFPKKYDIFNVQLYVTIILLTFLASRWMHNWISVYMNGSNAWFMWATILLPCWECFVMDSVRDRVPGPVARHPLMQEMAKWISVAWACALTVMAVAAVVPAALQTPHGEINTVTIVCNYVFGIGPFIPAIAAQMVLKKMYTKKIQKAFAEEERWRQQEQRQDEKVQPVAGESAV